MQNNHSGIVPSIQLGMDHKIVLSQHQKGFLLEERQVIIEESILAIQYNFFRIGKALAEIRDFRLYKADPIFPSWKEYVNNRIVPKLHQSTISDYIAIVKMQLENVDFIHEDELVKLGYKKVKLLKTKLNLIEKESDPVVKRNLKDQFKREYKKSFREYRNLPYSTYEKIFEFVKSPKKQVQTLEKTTKNFHIKLNKNSGTMTIKAKDKNGSNLEALFESIE